MNLMRAIVSILKTVAKDKCYSDASLASTTAYRHPHRFKHTLRLETVVVHLHKNISEKKERLKMQHVNNDNHANLIAAIIAKLTSEFQEKFLYQGVTYRVGSPAVLERLANEITGALTLKLLSPSQLDIINKASDEDITRMAHRIAGSLNIVAGGEINIMFGEGFTPNALAKIYFDALSLKVASFVNDLTLQSKKKTGAIIAPNQEPTLYSASNDKLKGDFFNDRRRPIQLEFCLGLLATATPEQIQQLKIEAALPRSFGMLNSVDGHQNFLRRFQSNPGTTASMDIYKAALEDIAKVHAQGLRH
jgi:hypothetical protein